MSVKRLALACAQVTSEDSDSGALCYAYLKGFSEGFQVGTAASSIDSSKCFPEWNAVDYAKMFAGWAALHPKYLNTAASVGVTLFYEDNFGCYSKAKSQSASSR